MKPAQLLIILLLLPLTGFTQSVKWSIDSLPERVENDFPSFIYPQKKHIRDYTTLRYKTTDKIKKLTNKDGSEYHILWYDSTGWLSHENGEIYGSSFHYSEDSESYIITQYSSSMFEGWGPDTSIYYYNKKTGYINSVIHSASHNTYSRHLKARVADYEIKDGKIINITRYDIGKEDSTTTDRYQYTVDNKSKTITVIAHYGGVNKYTYTYTLSKDGYYYKCDCKKGVTEKNKFCHKDCNERREEDNVTTISIRKLRKSYIIEYY